MPTTPTCTSARKASRSARVMRVSAIPVRTSGVEYDHAARRRALAHLVEGVIHLVELEARRDHLVALQLTREIEVDVARHVHAEAVVAHHRADDLLGADHDVEARQLDHLPPGEGPDPPAGA